MCVLNIFTFKFSIAFSDKHNVKVKNFMLDVMAPIIQEGESISQELLDSILINLVEPRKVIQLICMILFLAYVSSYLLESSLGRTWWWWGWGE